MSELRRRLRLFFRRLNMSGGSRTSEYDHNTGNISGPPSPGEFKDGAAGRG